MKISFWKLFYDRVYIGIIGNKGQTVTFTVGFVIRSNKIDYTHGFKHLHNKYKNKFFERKKLLTIGTFYHKKYLIVLSIRQYLPVYI